MSSATTQRRPAIKASTPYPGLVGRRCVVADPVMPRAITICEEHGSKTIFPQIRGTTDFGSIRRLNLWKPESAGIHKKG